MEWLGLLNYAIFMAIFIGIFAILALFAVFNLFAAVPLGYSVGAAAVALPLVLLLISTSVTLVAGAALYDTLRVELPDG